MLPSVLVRMFERRFPTILLAVLLIAFEGGCSPKLAGTRVDFAIAVDDHERQALQQLMSRFEDQTSGAVDLNLPSRFRGQGGIEVNLVPMRPNQLAHMLATGEPKVDLFAQDNVSLRPLVDQRMVEDLSAVQIPSEVGLAMVPPRFEGRQLFLPFRPNVRIAYANRDALSRAGAAVPRAIDELLPVAQKLKAAAGKPMVTLSLSQDDDGAAAAVTISELILANGGDPRLLDDPGTVRAFGQLRELWSQGLLARESLFAKYDTEVENLRSGRAWLAQNWTFTSSELARDGQLQAFEVYEGWQGSGAHVVGGDVLGMPRGVQGRQREATLELAQFLMSRQAQEFLVRENSWPAIREDAYGTTEGDPTFSAIQSALRNGWFRPNERYWADVTRAMNEGVNRIVLGAEPEAAVLKELHARVAATNPGHYPPSA